MALQNGEKLGAELFGNVERSAVFGVAVVKNDELVVPALRYVDAVFHAAEYADFGYPERGI